MTLWNNLSLKKKRLRLVVSWNNLHFHQIPNPTINHDLKLSQKTIEKIVHWLQAANRTHIKV